MTTGTRRGCGGCLQDMGKVFPDMRCARLVLPGNDNDNEIEMLCDILIWELETSGCVRVASVFCNYLMIWSRCFPYLYYDIQSGPILTKHSSCSQVSWQCLSFVYSGFREGEKSFLMQNNCPFQLQVFIHFDIRTVLLSWSFNFESKGWG